MKNFQREIIAQNAFKKYAKKVLVIIMPQLEQFVGKKIFTANGDKAKIFNSDFSKIAIEPIEGMHIMVQHCYPTAKYGKLNLVISICMNGGSYDDKPSTAWTKYSGRDIEIGFSKDGILNSLDTIENIIQLYNLDEVISETDELAKAKKYKELQDEADKVKSRFKLSSEFYKYL